MTAELTRWEKPWYKVVRTIYLESCDLVKVDVRESKGEQGVQHAIVVVVRYAGWVDAQLVREAISTGQAWRGKVFVQLNPAGGLDIKFNHLDLPETRHLSSDMVDELEAIFEQIAKEGLREAAA